MDPPAQDAAPAGPRAQEVACLIEQGPAGLRVLAFCGGTACCANAALFLFGVLNPVSVVSQMVAYVLHCYLIAFALTTMLFEAKPEWIEMVSGLNSYQNLVLDKAQFLAEVLGRGLFYGFQGTLWLAFASLSALQNYALGLWLLLMAALHVAMHFGVMPHEVVAKMQIRGLGYRPLSRGELEGGLLQEAWGLPPEVEVAEQEAAAGAEASWTAGPAEARGSRQSKDLGGSLWSAGSSRAHGSGSARVLSRGQPPSSALEAAEQQRTDLPPLQPQGGGDGAGEAPAAYPRKARAGKAMSCCVAQ